MQQYDLIAVEDLCNYHQIEVSFIQSLSDSGLVTVSIVEHKPFVQADELPRIEKFIRLHYELDINIEGIETIDYLLHKVEVLQRELNHRKGGVADA